MQNILKTGDFVKIYINYITDDKVKVKTEIRVRYMDQNTVYFATPTSTAFKKPKNKSEATIVAYTTEGVYSTTVKALGANVSINEALIETTVPTTWNFKQLRKGSRKEVQLPVNIKFDDGFEINATSYDLSIGGVSFDTGERISSIYQRLKCKATIQLPNNLLVNFPDGKFICDAIFVRMKENDLDFTKRYVFKFLNMSDNDVTIVEGYLLKLGY